MHAAPPWQTTLLVGVIPFPSSHVKQPARSPLHKSEARSLVPEIRTQPMGSFMLPSNDRNLFQNINLPQLKTIISTAASVAATVVFVRTITSELVPGDIGEYFSSRLRSISKKLSSEFVVVIDEFNGIAPNQLFEAATVHLGSQVSPSIRRIKANKSDHDKELSFAIDEKEEFVDQFEGVKLKWTLLYTRINHPQQSRQSNNKHSTVWKSDLKYYELKFNMKHKEMVFRRYLPHLLQTAKSIKWRKKEIKLHTVDYNGTDYWSCVNLDHPATFDKIAMDPAQKKALIEDLDRFRNRRDYYKRVGKAWKRGYLLYGPPGTGKSSLIAAIANYSSFDVYDLDLKEVMCNSDLRRLLVGTASKSILVIEDIDCSMDLKNRENAEECAINDDKVTLSGLLNFTDGLWSSCGDERIIIFTTNHKDRLDPALLRPGRMDVHIEMSYCSFISFKILAATYLGIQEHPRYREIEELMDRVQATPADVAGELMKSDEVEAALQGLIEFMHAKSKNKGISD